MEEKYLPIGSVCTLKGKNKKIMITGYYSIEFSGNLKIKDYLGCVYPEGMLLPEQTCTFNHTDIERVDFIGFKNDEQETFQRLLDRLTGNDIKEEEKAAKFHKENDMFLTSNNSYSKLLFDENGVVMIADPLEKKEENIKKTSWDDIKFDENGYVISTSNDDDISNPFHKEYKEKEIKKEVNSSEWNIFNKIEFDENGTVVSVEEKNVAPLNKIEFDENGVVIAVNGDSLKEEEDYTQYRFDENGTLIAIGDEQMEDYVPPIGPGLPGYVSPREELENSAFKEEYKFDENGTLIAIGDEQMEDYVPPIGPGLPGYVEPKKKEKSKYKFDENGTVVEIN